MSNDVAVAIIAGIFTLAAAAASAILGRRAYRASRTAKVETDQAAGSDHSVTAAWESIATTMTQPLMDRIKWLEEREKTRDAELEEREQRREAEMDLVRKRIHTMSELIDKLRSELRATKRINRAIFHYAILLRRQISSLNHVPVEAPDEWELLAAVVDAEDRSQRDPDDDGHDYWQPVP